MITALQNHNKTRGVGARIGAAIHNRFDIVKRNVETGREENFVAYNIVLDQMYTRLCGRSSYFVNIHFGTGTGTLSASRTSLFTHLGTKAAANDAQSKALPTSYWRQKIVLNPEEYVGSALSEVGIAYGSTSTNLLTHALIKDMNGNPVTLTKTALDVVTIYATVYVTFSTSNANLQLCGMPDSNPLVNYLIGGASVPSLYLYAGQSLQDNSERSPCVVVAPVGTSSALTLTSDVANKKFYTNTYRFAIDAANGDLSEFGLGGSVATPIFRLKLPAAGIYSGLDLAGVSVGTGNGASTKFTLPSANIDHDTVVVYVDGVETSVSKADKNGGFAGPLSSYDANPIQHNTSFIQGAAMSSDGSVLAFSGPFTNGSPDYLRVYKNTDGVLSLYSEVVPSGSASKCYLTPNGNHLAVAYTTAPYVDVWDRVDDVWTKRTAPTGMPAAIVNDCLLSDDGLLLVIVVQNSPYMCSFDWSGSAWSQRANPATLPPAIARGCALSADKTLLAVAHNTSPYITTYDWSAGAWVKRSNPADLPGATLSDCALTADGSVLVCGISASPYLAIYDWSAGAWVRRSALADMPSSPVYGTCISADGNVLALAQTSSPYFLVYDLIDGAYIKATNPSSLPYGATNDCAVTSDGLLVAVATYCSGSSPYQGGRVYERVKKMTEVTFASPPANGAVITADYTVNGIHKTAQRVIDLYAEIVFGEVT